MMAATVTTSFLLEFNTFCGEFLSNQIWCVLQGLASVAVIYGCLIQRVYQTAFKDINKSYLLTKFSQVGLYLQMMVALMTMVDAYYNFEGDIPHSSIALWAIGSAMIKVNVFFLDFHAYRVEIKEN